MNPDFNIVFFRRTFAAEVLHPTQRLSGLDELNYIKNVKGNKGK